MVSQAKGYYLEVCLAWHLPFVYLGDLVILKKLFSNLIYPRCPEEPGCSWIAETQSSMLSKTSENK